MRNVISNTSCLIALTNIGRLEILQKRYRHIIITPEVAQEFDEPLPDWISVVPVKDAVKTELITKYLDRGESSTIALASEVDDPLVILDDGKARAFAKNSGLTITGTLGILVKAYEMGLVTGINDILDDLRSVKFRIPNGFEDTLPVNDKKRDNPD
jgi:predicted nucleic acid-binding protein